MITAQDIRDVQFSKSLGGYKTGEVDTFLDQCADTFDRLTAEKTENERKMQVLAESIVEYRNQEDSIRATLLSAQKMSETVINEANEKAAAILAEAQNEADHMLGNARQSIVHEQNELQRIRDEVAAFKSKLYAIYREHLTLIGVLEDSAEPADASAEKPVSVPEAAPVAAIETAAAADAATADPISLKTEDEQPKLDFSAFVLKED